MLASAGYLVGQKLGGKFMAKAAAKFAPKFAGKGVGGFVPVLGPALSGGVNLWLLSGMMAAVTVPKRAMPILWIWLILLLWFETLIPLPLFFPLFAVALIVILLGRREEAQATSGEHSSQHLQALADEIGARQQEIKYKTALRATLNEEIAAKIEENEELDNLTQRQKDLLIDAARDALARRSTLQVITTAVAAVVLNLIATITWTLAGSPGQGEIVQRFKSIIRLFDLGGT